MTRVEIDGFTVHGLCVRTCNRDEARPFTARIGPLGLDSHRRAYTTDFERYRADGPIDICIAVRAS